MPKPFPAEFRRDVIAVARNSDASRAQIARDFGISESCLNRWLKIADREDGLTSSSSAGDRSSPTAGTAGTAGEQQELRELRRRNRELEQENEVLRRRRRTSPGVCSQNDVPAGP